MSKKAKVEVKILNTNAEHCVCCGRIIPEGRQICPICQEQIDKWHIPIDLFEDKEDEDNGTERN